MVKIWCKAAYFYRWYVANKIGHTPFPSLFLSFRRSAGKKTGAREQANFRNNVNFINPPPGVSSPTRRGRSGFQERREIAYGTTVLLTTYILQPYKQKIACQRAVVAPAPPLLIALQLRKCHYPQWDPHRVPAGQRVVYAADGVGGCQNACVARRTGSRSPLSRGGARIGANGK